MRPKYSEALVRLNPRASDVLGSTSSSQMKWKNDDDDPDIIIIIINYFITIIIISLRYFQTIFKIY